MESLVKLAEFVKSNWASATVVIGVVVALYFKIKQEIDKYKKMSEEEKQEEIQKQIEKVRSILADQVLALVATAEIAWSDEGAKLGPVKRSEVIRKIYVQYPVLTYVVDQEELLSYIDKLIDKALETVREKIRKSE